jgi:hypothetical protein
MVSFLSNKWWCAIVLSIVVLILLVGLSPSPHPALAQEDTVAGDWELDLQAYRILESDGSTRDENLHGTIVVRLSEGENGITGSVIKGSEGVCTDGEISGTSQDNRVNLVFHYTGSCCPDSEEMFQGTISADKKTMTGAWSSVGSPSSGCESWRSNITGTKVAGSDTEPPTVSWVKPEGIIRFENRDYYPATKGTVALEVAVNDNTGIRSVLFERFDEVNQQLVELTIDSSAPYQASVEVNTLSMEWNQIRAVAEDTAGNLTHATLLIFRLNPTITLDLTEGSRGTEVTVQGSGWIAGDIVSIQFAESGNEVAQATVDTEGNFTTTFTVPADAPFGEKKVLATTTNGFWQTDAIFQVTEPKDDIATDVPGTPLSKDEEAAGILDLHTMPRHVYALELQAGVEIRITLSEGENAYVELADPGAGSIVNGDYTWAMDRVWVDTPPWQGTFTPAVDGTYYLIISPSDGSQTMPYKIHYSTTGRTI